MTDERRNEINGRRQGKDRRDVQPTPARYEGVERRAGDRRAGVSRRIAR